MKDRLSDISVRITGTMLLLPLIVLFFTGEPYSKITVFICAIIMILEYSFLATKHFGMRCALIVLICYFGSTSLFLFEPVYHILSLILIAILLFRFFPHKSSLMGLCLAILLFSIGHLSHYQSFQGVMTYVVATIICVDTGAYIVGRFAGGPKLLPFVSPAKTISGAFGGLIGGMFSGVSIFYFFNIKITFWLVLLTFFITILAQVGDITESYFKRSINTKDSAKIIPGHGGFMDRFDGYLYVVPFVALSPVHGIFV